MYRFNDLTGKQINHLTVIKQHGRTKDRHIIWECKCVCGKTTYVSSHELTTEHTKSCGCIQKDAVRNARFIHGDRDSRLYLVWKSMKKRCENPKNKSYKYYGAKGVSVCDEWHDYLLFKKWAMENGYNENAPKGVCTIDRINPYGNYEPNNCRWVSMAEQNKNKRIHAEAKGESDGR